MKHVPNSIFLSTKTSFDYIFNFLRLIPKRSDTIQSKCYVHNLGQNILIRHSNTQTTSTHAHIAGPGAYRLAKEEEEIATKLLKTKRFISSDRLFTTRMGKLWWEDIILVDYRGCFRNIRAGYWRILIASLIAYFWFKDISIEIHFNANWFNLILTNEMDEIVFQMFDLVWLSENQLIIVDIKCERLYH